MKYPLALYLSLCFSLILCYSIHSFLFSFQKMKEIQNSIVFKEKWPKFKIGSQENPIFVAMMPSPCCLLRVVKSSSALNIVIYVLRWICSSIGMACRQRGEGKGGMWSLVSNSSFDSIASRTSFVSHGLKQERYVD